jgi:hypothetical protein
MTLDMRKTVAPKSDQVNADDLIGRTMTIKITKVTGNDSPDQPVSIYFEGDGGKPYKPCKSMRRVMIHVWGHEAQNYVGRSMTLYCDTGVKFGGLEVGGIRISHMSHIDKAQTMALTASKANKKPFTVKPLAVAAEPKADEEYPKLKVAGDAAAAAGVESYKNWIAGLDAAQKGKVKQHHADWTAAAKAADTPAPTEPEPAAEPATESEVELPI